MEHQFGIGSMAEPCEHCHCEFAMAIKSPHWAGTPCGVTTARGWRRFSSTELGMVTRDYLAAVDRYFGCDCYVRHLNAETRFGLHYGAHNPACPAYRVSRDSVDRAHDDAFRARVETENAAFDSKRPAIIGLGGGDPDAGMREERHGAIAMLQTQERAERPIRY